MAVYDPSETVVTTDRHIVAKLGAGEKLGIGYDVLSDDAANGIGRLDVEFEEGFGDSVPEGSFSVSEVATSTDEFSTETTFVVTSTYAIDIDSPYAYVIYRDSGGRDHRRHLRLRRDGPRQRPSQRHPDLVRPGRRHGHVRGLGGPGFFF